MCITYASINYNESTDKKKNLITNYYFKQIFIFCLIEFVEFSENFYIYILTYYLIHSTQYT